MKFNFLGFVMSIKDMVAGKVVRFVRFESGDLVYITECGMEFPIPSKDTVGATFLAEDKAILFMRWIRAQVQLNMQYELERQVSEAINS
jgi:hypothetical protein